MIKDLLSFDEISRTIIGPQLVFVVLVQLYTRLLSGPPHLGDGVVGIGLVDDLGYYPGHAVNHLGLGSREFGAGDDIVGTIHDQERKQGPDAVEEKTNNGNVDEKKQQDPPTHRLIGPLK